MRLWLDDERNPKTPFIQEKFGAEPDMIWVKSANQAIMLLNGGSINYISFDHDLGEGAGNGYEVAQWIEEQAFYGRIPKLEWNIHSSNPVGAKRIRQAMLNAEKYWSRI